MQTRPANCGPAFPSCRNCGPICATKPTSWPASSAAAHSRGHRWGARLLDEMEVIARAHGCVRLVLDTALSNALAQRFYFRQGMLTGAMRFAKPLEEPTA